MVRAGNGAPRSRRKQTLTIETTEVLFARYGPRYRWLVTTTGLLGTISAMVTTTSVNVAIPDIMGTFGMGQDRAQWLSTGALAAVTVAMLVTAWFIRSFGERKTLSLIHISEPTRLGMI